ncbi:hypothetical protein COOONC_01715 [Cooperia oncophora]
MVMSWANQKLRLRMRSPMKLLSSEQSDESDDYDVIVEVFNPPRPLGSLRDSCRIYEMREKKPKVLDKNFNVVSAQHSNKSADRKKGGAEAPPHVAGRARSSSGSSSTSSGSSSSSSSDSSDSSDSESGSDSKNTMVSKSRSSSPSSRDSHESLSLSESSSSAEN